MCNLYDIGPARRSHTTTMRWEGEIERLVSEIGIDYVAPSGRGVVVRERAGDWGVETMRWGFARPWSSAINNARDDKIDQPTWNDAWRSRRCLIPLRRFYEWSGSVGNKRKQAITPAGHADGWFYIGGIWEPNPDPTVGFSYAMLTTAANESMRSIHHRMPLILNQDQLEGYLFGPSPEAMLTPFGGVLDFRSDQPEQFELEL